MLRSMLRPLRRPAILAVLAVLAVLDGLVGLALAAPAQAEMTGTTALSWSSDEVLSHIEWPVESGEENAQALLELYLTIEVESAIDSVGFDLRWAAERPEGSLRLLRVASPDGEITADLMTTAPGPVPDTRRRTIVPTVSVAELLERIAVEQPDGTLRYPLRLELASDAGPMLRLQAHGVTVRGIDGDITQLGSPSVSTSGGWRLRMPPQLVTIENLLNRRFLVSDLTMTGIDLDQVAGVMIEDQFGNRVPPNLLKSRLNDMMVVTVPNKMVKAGPCTIEIVSGNCFTQRIDGILEATVLEERQPGDDNLGAVPYTPTKEELE